MGCCTLNNVKSPTELHCIKYSAAFPCLILVDQPVFNYEAISIIKDGGRDGRGEKTPPEATFMAVSVNTKGVVKSACCLHSEVLGRVMSAWQIGRGVCLSKSF